MTSKVIKELLETESHDPGCEACFELLDQYVDAVLSAQNAEALFPQVAAHIRQCTACREDTQGLIAALQKNIQAEG